VFGVMVGDKKNFAVVVERFYNYKQTIEKKGCK
jgi:hypothetical protein